MKLRYEYCSVLTLGYTAMEAMLRWAFQEEWREVERPLLDETGY